MNRERVGIIALVAWSAAGFSALPVHADTIQLRNGRSFEGTVVSEAGDTVVLEIEKFGIRSRLEFSRQEIEEIVRGQPAAAPEESTPPTAAPQPPSEEADDDADDESDEEEDADEPDDPNEEREEPLVRLDLAEALGDPGFLFPESLRDEGIVVEPGRRRILFCLPVTYRVPEKVRHITRGSVRVKPDRGGAIFKGIILLADGEVKSGRGAPLAPASLGGLVGEIGRQIGQTAAPAAATPTDDAGRQANTTPELQAPSNRDPFWERVTPKVRDGVVYLECANTRKPKAPRPAVVPRPSRSSRSDRRSRSRSSDRESRPRPPVVRPPASTSNSRYDERSASGSALFVYEILQDAKTLVCTVRGEPPIETTLDIEFLRSLGEDLSQSGGADRIPELASGLGELPGAVAQVRIAQLASLRRVNPPAPDAGVDPLADAIAQALSHPDPAVGAAAWTHLESGDLLSDAVLEAIAASEKPQVYETILQGVQESLARTRVVTNNNSFAFRSNRNAFRRRFDSDEVSLIVPSTLPDSQVAPNAYDVLRAVLQSKAAGDGAAAIDLILADPTKESISALAGVSRRVQAAAIQRLETITNLSVAVPLAKTLLLEPDPTLVAPLLERVALLRIRIEDPNDPLVTAPRRAADPAVQAALLGALAQLDWDPIFDSRAVDDMLAEVAAPESDPRTQMGAIMLAERHWRPVPALPILGDARQRQVSPPRGGVESVFFHLASSAFSPTAAAQAQVRAGAVALLAGKGYMDEAAVALRTLEPAPAGAVLSALAGFGTYHPDRLGVVLADAAGDNETVVASPALQAITAMYNALPPQEHWRLSSALAAGLYFEGLADHTAVRSQAERGLADMAVDVLGRAASLTSAQQQQLRSRADVDSRIEYLAEINRERAVDDFAGTYRVRVSLDVHDATASGASATGQAIVRPDVALDGGTVGMVGAGERQFTMSVGSAEVAVAHQSSLGRPGTVLVNANLDLDAAALVRSALRNASGEVTKVLGPVTVSSVASLPNFRLSHAAFGRWQGEADLNRLGRGGAGNQTAPTELVRVRIILDRVGDVAAR